MPNVSRPDLLPFALPSRIGPPYHGLVKTGALTLPNATTMSYPAFHSSSADNRKRSIVVRGKDYETTVSTTGQPAAYRWQNYALLSGALNQIGGQSLTTRSWIYSDANHSWWLEYSISQTTSAITITATLAKSFGVISDESMTMSPRTLATYTFSPVHRETGVATTWTGSWKVWFYPSQHGDSALLFMVPPNTRFPLWYEAVQLTVAGNGSLAPGIVGTGISAIFSHYANAAALFGANVYHVGKNYAGLTIESGYSLSESYDRWFAEEDGIDYAYQRHTGEYSLWIGSIWTKSWAFDYTERWPADDLEGIELVSGTYPDTMSGFGAKPANTDIVAAEIAVPGGGVIHYLVHLSAGLLTTMSTASYFTPACDPITGEYSMDRNDEFYV